MFHTFQKSHKPLELADHKVSRLADLNDQKNFEDVLERILVPRYLLCCIAVAFVIEFSSISRVVGTESHEGVKDFIVAKLRELSWHVDLDEFEADTPIFKNLLFTNIIATLNPKSERFLVLACHYDSKYFKNEEFLGATDSAVPCAMLINLAHVMNEHLLTLKTKKDVSIKLIFFDGEEAFESWTATDSIYGARHLAEKWEDEKFLHRIDMLVLLDLLGSPDPTFYSFFKETETWYARLVHTEERLDDLSQFNRYQSSGTINRNPTRYFQANTLNANIEDDHIPVS